MLKYWIVGLCGTAVAYCVTPSIARLARAEGALAASDDRHVHQGQVPCLGGLAVLIALLAALAIGAAVDEFVLATLTRPGPSALWLLAGLLLSVACGAIDDIWPLGVLSKLALQTVAASFVLLAGYGIGGFTNPFSGETIGLGWLSAPVTLLWVVGITNAFNLIDGLDGLAAGVALIASATLFVIALGSGQVEVAVVAIALAGALLGFLYYNFHPAKVFLGDSGSLLLGFVLAVLSMHALQKGATAVVIATPILALGLPIAETALSMARRFLGALTVVADEPEGSTYRFALLRSPSIARGDRDHIHHRLLTLGLTHRRAVLLLYCVCLALNLLAFMAVRARGQELAMLVAIAAIAAALAIRRLGYDEMALLRRGTLLPLFDVPVLSGRALRAVLDAGFLAVSFGMATVLAGGDSAPSAALRPRLIFALVMVTAIKLAVLVYAGVYRRSLRWNSASDLVDLGRALFFAEAAALAALLAGIDPPAPIPVLLLDFYFSATLIVGSRFSFRILERLALPHPTPDSNRRVLIYGSGPSGIAALSALVRHEAHPCTPIGFLDDREELWGARIEGLPVLGGGDHLEALLSRHRVSEVILAVANLPASRRASALHLCRQGGARLLAFRTTFEPVADSDAAG